MRYKSHSILLCLSKLQIVHPLDYRKYNQSFSDPFVTYNDSQYNPANADPDQSRHAQHVHGDHLQSDLEDQPLHTRRFTSFQTSSTCSRRSSTQIRRSPKCEHLYILLILTYLEVSHTCGKKWMSLSYIVQKMSQPVHSLLREFKLHAPAGQHHVPNRSKSFRKLFSSWACILTSEAKHYKNASALIFKLKK